jgi:hypothetical protein
MPYVMGANALAIEFEHGDAMTLDQLLSQAAQECIVEREGHLAVFTTDLNGYVCRNDGAMEESRALFKGTYLECQVWIEQRGVAAALAYVSDHMAEVPELSRRGITVREVLALLSRQPEESH